MFVVLLVCTDDVSLRTGRRRGSLSERLDDDEPLFDVAFDVVNISDLSSVDSFLDGPEGTDVVDGTRPRRLKR